VALQHFYDAMQYPEGWHAFQAGTPLSMRGLSTRPEEQESTGALVMATSILSDTGCRTIPSRSIPRRVVARMIAVREVPPRRRVNAFLLGLDDAGIAMAACDRRALEEAGRGQFPL
jgi:hypothetical protein